MTEEGKYSLDAYQNNPSKEGTLRHEINRIETEFAEKLSNMLLPYGGTMPGNADFNDYRTRGWYSNGGTNAGQINVPHRADRGYLFVISESRMNCRQIWIGMYAFAFKTRYLKNDTWTAWQSFVLE